MIRCFVNVAGENGGLTSFSNVFYAEVHGQALFTWVGDIL